MPINKISRLIRIAILKRRMRHETNVLILNDHMLELLSLGVSEDEIPT